MAWTLALLAVGLLLSAFFSGSETGFYRIPRVRLLLDSLSGDLRARGLLWLTNHASLFVATTLVGNNLANYIMSLAIVIGARSLFQSDHVLVGMAPPIVLAPILFVYGELLPKYLFLRAPVRLLRACGPLFLFFTLLFAPVTALLWALSKVLEWIVGESPQQLHRRLARKELRQVLEDGHAAGILRPSQRALAQGIFSVATRGVTEFSASIPRAAHVTEDASVAQVLEVAKRYHLTAVPVVATSNASDWVGYYRVAEVYADRSLPKRRLCPLPVIPEATTHLAALMQMQRANATLARVVAKDGTTQGLVTRDQLSEPLFRGDA